MTLCAICQSFDIQEINDCLQKSYCYELDLVAIAASEGCAFCQFIYNNKPASASRDPNHQWIHFRMRTHSEIGYDMLLPGPGLQFTQLHVWIGPKRSFIRGRYHKEFRLVSDPGSAAELSGDIPRTYIGNASDSEYQFNVMRQWLMECQSRYHSACNTTIPGDILIDDNYQVPLPSRLISVGYPGNKTVFLAHETKGEKGAYITLSYVWGAPERIPTTTTANIGERRKGILIETLPKTFQDVITITRKLNVPYVWIDALCIVQDDEEDWNREASQMARIYQFSLLTVAATGAADASKGCFLERVPTSVEIGPLVKLPYRTKEGIVSGQFSVYEQHTTFAEEYNQFVEKSPLLKRAWVFQERVLSRRMVHYTRGKMFFECRTLRVMDECQEGVSKNETKIGFWGEEIKAKGEVTAPEEPKPFQSSILSQWYMAVSIYSQLRLTKAADKLAAIAGVAKEFQMLLSIERDKVGKPGRDGSAVHTPLYLSGLWSHDLLYGLSWYPSKPQKMKIAGNKAPFWSWVAWHTPIAWPVCTSFKPECKVVVLGTGKQHTTAEPMNMKSRRKVKASSLSSFVADLPRGIFSDTTMAFLSELEITGKIREVWRRPQDLRYLAGEERKAFSDACELNGDEKQWLQHCHAVYSTEDAPKPGGFGCFEDHWLAKSAASSSLEQLASDLNAGLDEDEAVKILLSLKDENGKSNEVGPSNTDEDLELAVVASLGKAPPTKNKVVANQVDLDEEFNDNLAIALLLSAEESSKNGNLNVEQETEEELELGGIQGQVVGDDGPSESPQQNSFSTNIKGKKATNSQTTESNSTEDAVSNESEEETESIHRSIDDTSSAVDIKGKQRAVPDEVIEPASANRKGNDIWEHSSNIQTLITVAEASQDTGGGPFLNPLISSNDQLPHIPAKLHCLPLYSTRASGGLSYLGLSPTVYTVLFLRASGERDGRRVFERVGVGKVVERGFFGNSQTETTMLV